MCVRLEASSRNDFYNVSEASLESERAALTLCPLAIAHIHRTIQALERTSSDPRRLSASRAQVRQHLPTGRARRSTHCSRPARHDRDAFLGGEQTERHHAEGVMIAKVSDISPFKNVLEFGDLLLSATIVNSSGQSVEYKFGSRVNQYPPGILIYRPVNNKIQIKYIKGVYFNNNNTIQEAEIDLTTYGQIGENYAYLDCFLRGASMAPMKKIKNLDLNEN